MIGLITTTLIAPLPHDARIAGELRLAPWDEACATVPRALARARRTGQRVGVVLLPVDDWMASAKRPVKRGALLAAVADQLREEDLAFATEGGHPAVLVEGVGSADDVRVMLERMGAAIARITRARPTFWMAMCDATGRFTSCNEVTPRTALG